MTIYNPVGWVNDSTPAINASALNHMDAGIQSAHVELASQAVQLGSSIAFASDLGANLGANATAIANATAVLASHGAAIASLIAADVALASSFSDQNAAVASNTAAIASMMPAVDAHGSQLSTLAGLPTQVAEVVATQGAHATSLVGVLATQGAHASAISIFGPVASQVENLASDLGLVAAQATQVVAIRNAAPYANRSGRGPADLLDASSNLFFSGATTTNVIAVGAAVVPGEDWVVGAFEVEQFGTSAGQVALGVLNSVGSVIAYSAPTSLPAVGTSIGATRVIPATPSGAVLAAGEQYHFVLLSDDELGPNVYGVGGAGLAPLWRRGLVHEWSLPSGLDLSLYGGLPLGTASSIPPTSGGGIPVIFVS